MPTSERQAKYVTHKLRYADFSSITRSYTLLESIDGDRAIFKTSVELLDKALAVERRAVRLIGIGVSHLVEASQQSNLFASSNKRLEELNRVIDRFRHRHGFTAIQTARAIRLKDISPRS